MRTLLAVVLLAMLAGPARAQTREVRINISGGGHKIQLYCEAFTGPPAPAGAPAPRGADEVLASDLEQSGVFLVSRAWAGQPPFDVQAVTGGRWTVSGGQVTLDGEVRDFPARRQILARSYRGPASDWRALVHRFADDIVLQFTGEPGVSRTQVAFVGRKGRIKELYVMDLDGANLRPLTNDRSIVLSPSWSPDGSLIVFATYRDGGDPHVYVVAATGGKVYQLSARPGINSGPEYSPDGRQIVCTLSRDGNPEIYVLDARGGNPRRLTDNRAIDTSPCWSPTGQQIAFTSDRSGTPQVYVMDASGANAHRLTFDVDYTDSPAWSPKGDLIAFVSRTSSGFDIYVCRPDGTGSQLAVTGGSNENPSWSPDGRHLLFASDRDGPFALYVTDLDGRPPRKLDTGDHVATSPAWSPRRAGSAPAAQLGSPHTNPGGSR
ncbi:MAG TPA: Tol-Pal system beta propeller repeat protein TolB [Terriglobales bacterium]|nr:Tol-Pal system beta propeller repeat protein TolB [Terriglobales bacterium]